VGLQNKINEGSQFDLFIIPPTLDKALTIISGGQVFTTKNVLLEEVLK